MSRFKCCSCDVPLTVEQLRIEVGICPDCRAEHDEGYAANRRFWMARLLGVPLVLHYRQYRSMVMESLDLAPRAPWVYTSQGEN